VTDAIEFENPDGDEPFCPDDWLTAAETIRLVRDVTLSPSSHITIATRAHAGLLRAHAELLVMDKRRELNTEVPARFWWARGHDALTQNWETGDFETWVGDRLDKVRVQAFGVRFFREDLRRMIPSAFPEAPMPVVASETPRPSGGRSMSPHWPDWVAELVATIHEDGIPEGRGTDGTDQLITRLADGLAKRGKEGPARSTVQPAVHAVLRRMRDGAEN
jgi:hypothetical protein